MSEITTTRGPWVFRWSPGARLASVFHAESDTALACTQVGDYDWRAPMGEGGTTDAAELERAADEWIESIAEDYGRELPYLP